MASRYFEIYQQYVDDDIEHLVTLPQRATSKSAGYDLHATRGGIIKPGERQLIETGVTAYMPDDEQGEVRSRSGLALKHGVAVLNSPGTIDADYYGKEIQVLLINHGSEDFEFAQGDRIAQFVFTGYKTTADDDPVKNYRSGGFGHTGR